MCGVCAWGLQFWNLLWVLQAWSWTQWIWKEFSDFLKTIHFSTTYWQLIALTTQNWLSALCVSGRTHWFGQLCVLWVCVGFCSSLQRVWETQTDSRLPFSAPTLMSIVWTFCSETRLLDRTCCHNQLWPMKFVHILENKRTENIFTYSIKVLFWSIKSCSITRQ